MSGIINHHLPLSTTCAVYVQDGARRASKYLGHFHAHVHTLPSLVFLTYGSDYHHGKTLPTAGAQNWFLSLGHHTMGTILRDNRASSDPQLKLRGKNGRT